MDISFNIRNQLRWSVFAIPVAGITGSLVALFLWLLDQVTLLRWQHPWLLFLLPLAGVLLWLMYHYAGRETGRGNELVIAEINQPGQGVPGRMAPVVLISTLITHLFGGSAGREGTAVQIGGSLASLSGRWAGLKKTDLQVLLTCGIAAGFGAVFGTPFAGAVFALEVLAAGHFRYYRKRRPALNDYQAFIPCLVAALMADFTCSLYGIHHTVYQVAMPSLEQRFRFFHFNWLLAGKTLLSGCLFGLVAWLFIILLDAVRSGAAKITRAKWMIPLAGGLLIIGLTFALGTRDYLGLGVLNPEPGGVSIVSAFHPGGAGNLSWFWKLIFTVITIGMGFRGGEVTPLFFIGATLGNVLGTAGGAPVDLMAALGFIAVFAGASKTPFACIIMGIELFGGGDVVYYIIACTLAFCCSGRTGIYSRHPQQSRDAAGEMATLPAR